LKFRKRNLKKDVTQINPVIEEARNRMLLAATKQGASGVPSGFHSLDKITSGWQRSDLIIIAARPAMGKTAFVLSMAKNMAVDYNSPVAVFRWMIVECPVGQSSDNECLPTRRGKN